MPLDKNYFKTDPLNLKGKTPIGMAGFDNVRDTIDHQQNKILKEVIDDAITALGLPLSHINAAEITDVGTNTHAQIDTHIADATDPHGTTLTQTNLTVTGAFTSQGIDDNANAVAITIDSSERVGIGTTSPSGNLHIHGSSGEGNPSYEGGNLIISQLNSAGNWVRNTLISSASGSSVLEFGDAGNSRAGFIRYDNTLNKFFIATNSTGVTDSDVVIDSSGNVGIGTTSPGKKLHVDVGSNAGDGIYIDSDAAIQARIGWSKDTVEKWLAYVPASSNDLRFYDGTGDRVTLQSGGNVGIGTTSPTAKLHVNQASTTAAVPVLILDQADVSEEMIEFVTTIGTGNAIEAIGAKTLTTTHFVKVTLPGGLTRYIPAGTIA